MKKVVAVIPARGGSKGVPGKNLARVGGISLVGRAVSACRAARLVHEVLVSTDDPAIATEARSHGAIVIDRPTELAGDTATSESAVLHALDARRGARQVDVVVLVQCTSPFLSADEIDATVRPVLAGEADSAFTAAPFHGFVWQENDGEAVGVNHEASSRPRRQDRRAEYLETGAAYAMDVRGFREHGHRFFGRTILVPVAPERVLEIDEPADLERARMLAAELDPPARPTREHVDAVVLDFDGTQTDDRVALTSDGTEQVVVHRGDGLGIAALRRAGIAVLILSSEVNPVVAARAAKLRVPVRHGITDKGAALAAWCSEQHVDPARVLYLGNDVNDLPCFSLVGWPVAVASARPEVLPAVRLITTSRGGSGAVREVASWILGKDLA